MKVVKNSQKGSVSLFVVIFAALLIITIATAFIRIVLQDQTQATANDLSKSALDSAYAGVEDAKRAIVEYYQQGCPNAAAGTNPCDSLKSALISDISAGNDGWTPGCDATKKAGVATLTKGEVLVKTNDDDKDLDQAYTCVKVKMNPIDYVGSLTPNISRVLQLKAKDNAVFNEIKIQWFTYQGQPANLSNDIPYKLSDVWPVNRPAVMRAQLLQFKPDFHLSDFDSDYNYNSTLFLLPSLTGAGGTTGANAYFAQDKRKDDTTGRADYMLRQSVPQTVACNKTSTTSRYACELTIVLPDWNDAANATNRTAYLKLSQFYSTVNTDFRITMLDTTTDPAGKQVAFADVQPIVDSTGRANDIFRRIQSRIDLGASGVPNAEAAVDITKSLCKEFSVTNDNWAPGSSLDCPKNTP